MMFPLQMVMGGPAAAAGGLACLAGVGATIYAMRKKIPHPTEFAWIGCCYLRGGCHKHPALTVMIEVNEGANIPAGSDVYFYVEAGRFDAQTGHFPVIKETRTAGIFERVKLHIRQMDEFIKISLWRTGAISSSLLGELEINVQKDIVEKDFPQMEWYTLQKDGKVTVKVQLSFHRVDLEMHGPGQSPLVEYALIKAAREAMAKGTQCDVVSQLVYSSSLGIQTNSKENFEALSDKEKLRFLSKVLEGPLRRMGATGWRENYFKAVEGSRDRWQWKYWKAKKDMEEKKKPLGIVPLLAISTVLPDHHNRQQFYVKYHTKSGAVDLFLSRVDRDRDLWSDGLYEFLERLRQYIADHPPESDIQAFIKEEDKKRPRETIQLDKRTMLAPHKRGTTETATTPKKRMPVSVAAMVEEAMGGYEYEYEEEEEGRGVEDEEEQYEGLLRGEGSTGGPL